MQLIATSPSSPNRLLGSAATPLAPLLLLSPSLAGSTAPHSFASLPHLHSSVTPLVLGDERTGEPVGEIAISLGAPSLLASISQAQLASPSIELTIHELEVRPTLLDRLGAWGVWVQTDLLGVAAHAAAPSPDAASGVRAPPDTAPPTPYGDGLLRTPSMPYERSTGLVQFSHVASVGVPAGSAAEMRLRDAISEAEGADLELELKVRLCA